MPTLLLTGFEPFGGATVNPSAEAVRHLGGASWPETRVVTEVLPVDARRAPQRIAELLASLRPDVCLMCGQADGYAALAVERVAVNLCDFPIPDNVGERRVDEPIALDGPAAYFATAPARAMVDAARAAGVPAELSLSAGAYLCNMVFYAALHACADRGLPTRCGFVHLPALPDQVAGGKARASMTLATIVAGLAAMVDVARRDDGLVG